MRQEQIRRVGIITGGGDAPGLNAVIRAAVLTAHNVYGYEVVGVRDGFDGLLKRLPPILLTPQNVTGLQMRGGTILGAANRGSPFERAVVGEDGTISTVDITHEALACLAALDIDALIVAGGDGTLRICRALVSQGVKIVGVPKTIDNDLAQTDVTFGFDTAISTATEALDKLQTTAESHQRVMVLEVMGRDAGWIALVAGVAGGADVILIPEIPFDIARVAERLRTAQQTGERRYNLVMVAEGAYPQAGSQSFHIGEAGTDNARLGGIGYVVGQQLGQLLENEIRVTILGHLQRGGQPTPRDRWLATRFGTMAMHMVARGEWGHMVALQGTHMVSVPIEAAAAMKFVDPHGEMIQMARDLGISFGD